MTAADAEEENPVNFVYSTEADALYIELATPAAVVRTIEVSRGCLVDLDAADRPVGVELIHPASSYLSLIEVVGRWQFDRQQRLQLGAYPYQSLRPRRRAATSTGQARVHIGSESKLLTHA
jgi:uncharacterized protein YuzE